VVQEALGIGLNTIQTNVDQNVQLPPHYLPEEPTGNRYVNLNHPSESMGDASTIRGLNVNGNYNSDVILPPGAYQSVNLSRNSRLILGNAGDTDDAIYSFGSLNMNDCDVVVLGPVQVRVSGGLNLQKLNGNDQNPEWLNIYANGNVNMNAGSVIYGNIFAPGSRVTINRDSILAGTVVADHLTMNNNSQLLNGYEGPISSGDDDPYSVNGEDDADSNGGDADSNGGDADSNDDEDSEALIAFEADLHPAFDFTNTPSASNDTRRVANLKDLEASGFRLEVDGESLYMNKRFARRYQLAIFHAKTDLNTDSGIAEGSLAARLVTVLPEVYITQSGESSN